MQKLKEYWQLKWLKFLHFVFSHVIMYYGNLD